MSQQKMIEATPCPNTTSTLTNELRGLGIQPGDTVLVHASMKAIGWTSGGAQAVIQALMETVTKEGTLLFQTHSPTLSDPVEWENPPVPESWHETIRQTMPPYDRDQTPSTYLGVLPELFRKFPDVHRSDHPTFSMAAWGKDAYELTHSHPLHYALSDSSPLGKAYSKDALLLLLGVGYDSNTSFHLSEYRAEQNKEIIRGAPIVLAGERQWATYPDIEFNEDKFQTIGEAFEKKHQVAAAKVGQATSRLFSMKEAVDYAVHWLKEQEEG